MKYILYLFAIIIIIGFSFGLFATLGLRAAVPSILVLTVICIAMEYRSLDYLFFAMVGGLWLDLFYALPFGSFTGAMLIIGTLSYLLVQRVLLADMSEKYYWAVSIGAGVMTIAWLWLFTSLLVRIHWSVVVVAPGEILRHSWAMMIANGILALPVYVAIGAIVRAWRRRSHNPLQLS
jgi:hypothetical protein